MIELGEFRNTRDETPLSRGFVRKSVNRSREMHANIDYAAVIADLERKLSAAKPEDRANVEAVLNIARQQMAAGFGK